MCWKCDHPDATFEDWKDVIRGAIHRRGWTIQYVESDRAPFAYTIGLDQMGSPELLVSGLDPRRTITVMDEMFELARSGRLPAAGQQMTLRCGTRVEIVDVAQPDAHMGMAIAIEGREITAKQVVWADQSGHWPWSARFDHARMRQPVLGVRGRRSG